MISEEPAAVDYQLVAGFQYRCLPGCGLCCYTTPAVAPAERVRLIQLDPNLPLLEASGGWAQVSSRADGGACYFLRNERCGCHSQRPATCGEFPLTVHVGFRVQVSLVLSCPGVDLSPLALWAHGAPSGGVSEHFQTELAVVHQEIAQAQKNGQLRSALRRRMRAVRRLRQEGRWQSESEIRGRLAPHLERLIPTVLPAGEPPDETMALETLPMFYDPNFGRVAWRSHTAGTEFFTLREAGGIGKPLGVLASPTSTPGLDAPASTQLLGYLAYLLARDATISGVYEQSLESETILPERNVADELTFIAGQVIRLSALRRALSSDERGVLSKRDIDNGIRATDMDILDRPVAGLRL